MSLNFVRHCFFFLFFSLSLCSYFSHLVALRLFQQDKVVYKASSPDEESLVEFARFLGYELLQRSPPYVTLQLTGPAAMFQQQQQQQQQQQAAAASSNQAAKSGPSSTPPTRSPSNSGASVASHTEELEQLALCDFTSKRKRMSVVVRDAAGVVRVYCKGADATMLPLLAPSPATLASRQPNWTATEEGMTRFSDEGLRTLVVATAVHPPEWWDDPVTGWGARWARRSREIAVEGPDEEGHFKGACQSACRRCALEAELETDARLQLLGCTAIEDKLQKKVPQTIKSLLQAGIKVW